MQSAKDILVQYYDSFNQGNMDKFLDLLDENIMHDINQGKRQIGKTEFSKFMQRMNHCYKEKITNIVIMTNSDNQHAAVEFIVEGTYLATDEGLPPAKNQHYALPGGAFFEIKNGKICRITNYYNLNDWLKQVATA